MTTKATLEQLQALAPGQDLEKIIKSLPLTGDGKRIYPDMDLYHPWEPDKVSYIKPRFGLFDHTRSTLFSSPDAAREARAAEDEARKKLAESDLYFLWSISGTRPSDPWITFWGANGSGYRCHVGGPQSAGTYDKERVSKMQAQGGDDPVAVPASAVVPLLVAVPHFGDFHGVWCVPNDAAHRKKLRRAEWRSEWRAGRR